MAIAAWTNAMILEECREMLASNLDPTPELLREHGCRCRDLRLRRVIELARQEAGLPPRVKFARQQAVAAEAAEPSIDWKNKPGPTAEFLAGVEERKKQIREEHLAEKLAQAGGEVWRDRPRRVYRAVMADGSRFRG